MQPKTTFTYLLFSLLMLIAPVSKVDAAPVNHAEKAVLEKHLQASAIVEEPTGCNIVPYDYCLTNVLLSHAPVTQTGGSIAVKRVLTDKELLLLHDAKHSEQVSTSKGDHIKFADSLTHIFLFLFPYHFFW